MFEPMNEKGVEYLFYKNHEKLGFESIISFNQFPDIIAKRNGEIVCIELEYRLSHLNKHYFIENRGCINEKWVKENDLWRRIVLESKYPFIGMSLLDINNKLKVDEYGNLVHKSLKDRCDIVIYWIEDTKIDDDLEFMNLRLMMEKGEL